jgi:hypothetical protein
MLETGYYRIGQTENAAGLRRGESVEVDGTRTRYEVSQAVLFGKFVRKALPRGYGITSRS